jgi:hypothetical protein
MKKSFLMIEAIIGILLVSISAFALLNLNNTIVDRYSHIKQKIPFSRDAAIMVCNIKQKNHKTTKTAYDIISQVYDINNLDARKYLKERKYDIYYKRDNYLNLAELAQYDVKKVIISYKKKKIQYRRISDE